MTISFLRLFLPYCLKREPDGRYAVLNRKYPPVKETRGMWLALEPWQAWCPDTSAAISSRL